MKDIKTIMKEIKAFGLSEKDDSASLCLDSEHSLFIQLEDYGEPYFFIEINSTSDGYYEPLGGINTPNLDYNTLEVFITELIHFYSKTIGRDKNIEGSGKIPESTLKSLIKSEGLDIASEIIDDLNNFKESYNRLLHKFHIGEILNCASEEYPFSKSFDELNIDDWVCKTIHNINLAQIELVKEGKGEIIGQ